VLDTATTMTSMDLDTAKSSYGIEPESAGLELVKMNRPGAAYSYHFKTLTFGGVTVTNPEFRLESYELSKIPAWAPTVFIGMNVLRQLHLYIAYEEHTLYISKAAAK
jgi:hypothetical protein